MVNAIIRVVIKNVSENGLNFRLIEPNAKINSKGTDAVVDVKMALMDEQRGRL